MGDLGDGVRLRRAQPRLPTGDGRRRAHRPAEEPLLAAPRRAVARRRAVRGRARVRDRARGLRGRQAGARLLRAMLRGLGVAADAGGDGRRRHRVRHRRRDAGRAGGDPGADRQVPRGRRGLRRASSRPRRWTRSPTCRRYYWTVDTTARRPAHVGSIGSTRPKSHWPISELVDAFPPGRTGSLEEESTADRLTVSDGGRAPGRTCLCRGKGRPIVLLRETFLDDPSRWRSCAPGRGPRHLYYYVFAGLRGPARFRRMHRGRRCGLRPISARRDHAGQRLACPPLDAQTLSGLIVPGLATLGPDHPQPAPRDWRSGSRSPPPDPISDCRWRSRSGSRTSAAMLPAVRGSDRNARRDELLVGDQAPTAVRAVAVEVGNDDAVNAIGGHDRRHARDAAGRWAADDAR